MKGTSLKILFFCLSFLFLAALLLISRDAGISGDEEVHYQQSEKVYRYFASDGQNTEALNTPKTHLKYYGQSPDNICTVLIHWFNIRDIYGFRHLFSSFLGWLAIFISALFVRSLKGYQAAIFTLFLFAVSPRFMGHLQNNLKDIPFALAYISGIFAIIKVVFTPIDKRKWTDTLFIIISIAFAISIRPGGLLLIFYLLFTIFLKFIFVKHINKTELIKDGLYFFMITVISYLSGLLLWPYGLQNILLNPWKSLIVMGHFPTTLRQIFEGDFIWSDFEPWYYLPKYMLITIPLIVFTGMFFFFTGIKKIIHSNSHIIYGLLFLFCFFPPIFVIIIHANLYGAWRHLIFIYPCLIILAALGYNDLWQRIKSILGRSLFTAIFLLLIIHPVKFMIAAHPYYYLYYNQLTGGLKGAYGKYETDYYYHTMRSGAEWLKNYLNKNGIKDKITGSNFPVKNYFQDRCDLKFNCFKYERRNDYDWDYAIICNSYISPVLLNKGNFPPEGTIHIVRIDNVPVCAVVKRLSKLPFEAGKDFKLKRYKTAGEKYIKSLSFYSKDEFLYYQIGLIMNKTNNTGKALNYINESLKINSNYEPALLLHAMLEEKEGNTEKAKEELRKLIKINKKYYQSYVMLSRIKKKEGHIEESKKILMNCLEINPKYQPALKEFENSTF